MIKNLIRSLGLTGTASEITTALNTQSIEKRDDQLYTWAGVAVLVGPVGAESLRVALKNSNLEWVNLQLGGFGIQLSNPLVQQALLSFSQAGVPGCDVLAAQGIHRVSPYVDAGGTGLVSLANVQTALAEIDLEEKTIDWRMRFDAAMNTLGTSEQSSGIADIRAIADEMEAA